METKTAFNLNTAIQRWREHLSQSPHFRPENLEELETHLHDAVAALRDKALSEEEAFLVATRRIGGAPALEPEFAKVNGREVWMNRLLWMLVGAQLWPFFYSFTSVVADTAVIGGLLGFGYDFKSSRGNPYVPLVPVVLLTAVNVLALGACLAVCQWVLRKKGSIFAHTVASLLRRPLFVPILAGMILSILPLCFRFGSHLLLVKWVPLPSWGGIYSSQSFASTVFGLAMAIALAVLTVLLARRHLRPSTNS